MTQLARKLDERFQKMDPETLCLLEGAILSLVAAAENGKEASREVLGSSPIKQQYRLPGYSLGIRAGVDPTKLAHAADEE
ncbi:MAG: hypothetical protein JWM99_4338 [Verrucomicrobiales bacterium]|nr:hypothetical protein [Verrucomicrobiales bacterium]